MATGAEAIQLNTKTKKPVNPLIDFSTVTDFRLGSLSVTDTAGIKTWALGSTNGTKIGATGDKIGLLGATPIVRPSGNIFTALTNLGLITSPTLTEANVTGLVTDLAGKQPLDSDLTALAALTTTAYGRGTLELANGAAFISYFGKTTLAGYGITDAQGLDADLTAIAALSTDSFGRGLLTKTSGANVLTYIGAVLPTNTTATDAQFFTAYNATTGAFTKAQPAFTDISGTALKAQVPAVTAFTDAANTFVPLQTFNSLNSYALTATQLSNPGAPSITNVGTPGATTWRYRIVAKLADGVTVTAGGTAGVTITGNATLDSTNKNSLTWSAVTGASSYDVYRTTAGLVPSTTGKIANVTSPAYVDAGAAGDSALTPEINNTGSITGRVSTSGGLLNLNYIDARWYGVNVTGDPVSVTTNTANLVTARAAAYASGGTLWFPKDSNVKINAEQAITVPEKWTGDGSAVKLTWAGSSGATMVSVTNLTRGNEINDLILDGAGIAGRCLVFDGNQYGKYNNLYLKGFTIDGLKTLSTDQNCKQNKFHGLIVEDTRGSVHSCIYLHGGGGGNTCHSSFFATSVNTTGTTPGIILGNCDNNGFTDTYHFNNGTGKLFLVEPVIGADMPQSNYVFHMQGEWEQPSDTEICPAIIYGYDLANGQAKAVTNGTPLQVYYSDGSFNLSTIALELDGFDRLSIKNLGSGGKTWGLYSTNSDYTQGAGKFLLYNDTDSIAALVASATGDIAVTGSLSSGGAFTSGGAIGGTALSISGNVAINGRITTAIKPVTGDGTAIYSIDATTGSNVITVSNNGTGDLFGSGNVFGGLILITDTSLTGITAMMLVGYLGNVTLIGQSANPPTVTGCFTQVPGSANRSNIYWDGTKMVIENKTGATVAYRVVSLRMHVSS